MPSSPPEACANCGAPIPRRARSCPSCGADERTGWRETSVYDGLDLPDEAWADDDRALNPHRDARPRGGIAWYWIAAAALLLLTLVFGVLGLR